MVDNIFGINSTHHKHSKKCPLHVVQKLTRGEGWKQVKYIRYEMNKLYIWVKYYSNESFFLVVGGVHFRSAHLLNEYLNPRGMFINVLDRKWWLLMRMNILLFWKQDAIQLGDFLNSKNWKCVVMRVMRHEHINNS